MRRYFGILPVTIVAANILLVAKLSGIWSAGSEPPALDSPELAERLEALNPAAGDQPEAASEGEAEMAEEQAEEPFANPLSMTQSEIKLLQALAERRRTLDDRESEVERRESLLAAAEKRIEEKIVALKAVQQRIEDLLDKQNEAQTANMRRLVKVYENMKPKDAARIFENLDKQVLLRVVERMKAAKLAPILAKMDPLKAKVVTAELAHRRDLPQPPGPVRGG